MNVTIPLPRPAAQVWPTLTDAQRADVARAAQDAMDAEIGRLLGVTA